ncbi:hypothetical protein SLA2020_209300 [Shorea laevis]
MAKQSAMLVVEELKKLLSEKGDLDYEVQGKFEKLITDLQHPDPHHDPAVKRIFYGFNHFQNCKFDKHPEFFAELEEGQHPEFLVFACSDSRMSPSHILDFQPGEAFMARNIENMVHAFDQLITLVSATAQTEHSGVGAIIEYAIGSLEVNSHSY